MAFTAFEHIEYQGLPAVRLALSNGAQATVMLHGGHVVSWLAPDRQERIYISETAVFAESKAIRGGVPVIFPQFNERGPLPRHGFARTLPWALTDCRGDGEYAIATLQLTNSEQTRQLWPHAFTLELSVALSGQRLDMELEVINQGDSSFSFAAALHTYLRVKEVEECSLQGLRGQRYFDALTGETQSDSAIALVFDNAIDRIYYATENPLLLRETQRSLGINSENMPDTVVWNPWVEGCKAIADMPDKGFRNMLCVEAAVLDQPITLAPGEDWWGRQTLLAM